MSLPVFEELHVVSDLHMGGDKGFQILRDTQRLAAYVRWVSEQRPGEKVALVLNGDVIDTLAEKTEGYIATIDAEEVVLRIIRDPAFAPVWSALADFVRVEERTLVVVIGNHDLELSFPGVQELIRQTLCGTDPVLRERIQFSTIGAGFTCTVGASRVFCTHGNETDAWNYNRYEDLSRLIRRLNAARTMGPNEWQPNAGTKLVKDVMNEIKARYHWVDLLKPETPAAIGVLLALDPGVAEKIYKLIPVLKKKVKSMGDVDKRLSEDAFESPSEEEVKQIAMEDFLGPHMRLDYTPGGGESDLADQMFEAAEEGYEGFSPVEEPRDDTLGAGQYIWDRLTGWLRGLTPEEALRRALLDWLKDDNTFNISNVDDTCRDINQSVGSDIHFLVTGHTHLDRAIDLGGNRFYFNCGTWIRLLQFTSKNLSSEAEFKPVYDMLRDGSMEAIDKAEFDGVPFVLNRSGAVRIGRHGQKTLGQLLHIKDDGTGVKPEAIQAFER